MLDRTFRSSDSDDDTASWTQRKNLDDILQFKRAEDGSGVGILSYIRLRLLPDKLRVPRRLPFDPIRPVISLVPCRSGQ